MASTYVLISSNTLSSSAASVTFSSIPSTYTDLVLRVSARGDVTGQSVESLTVQFNGSGGTAYSYTRLRGTGSTASSSAGSSTSVWNFLGVADAAGATSNTFGSFEMYVPSYAANQYKTGSGFGVQEDNSATTNNITATAALWQNTSAITSMTILPVYSTNFVSGSSFYLYGLKSS